MREREPNHQAEEPKEEEEEVHLDHMHCGDGPGHEEGVLGWDGGWGGGQRRQQQTICFPDESKT